MPMPQHCSCCPGQEKMHACVTLLRLWEPGPWSVPCLPRGFCCTLRQLAGWLGYQAVDQGKRVSFVKAPLFRPREVLVNVNVHGSSGLDLLHWPCPKESEADSVTPSILAHFCLKISESHLFVIGRLVEKEQYAKNARAVFRFNCLFGFDQFRPNCGQEYVVWSSLVQRKSKCTAVVAVFFFFLSCYTSTTTAAFSVRVFEDCPGTWLALASVEFVHVDELVNDPTGRLTMQAAFPVDSAGLRLPPHVCEKIWRLSLDARRMEDSGVGESASENSNSTSLSVSEESSSVASRNVSDCEDDATSPIDHHRARGFLNKRAYLAKTNEDDELAVCGSHVRGCDCEREWGVCAPSAGKGPCVDGCSEICRGTATPGMSSVEPDCMDLDDRGRLIDDCELDADEEEEEEDEEDEEERRKLYEEVWAAFSKALACPGSSSVVTCGDRVTSPCHEDLMSPDCETVHSSSPVDRHRYCVPCPDEDEHCCPDDGKPHVRFRPRHKLVSCRTIFSWNFAHRQARRGPWEEMARDRTRFTKRIEQANTELSGVFADDHRSRWRKRFASDDTDGELSWDACTSNEQ